MISLLRLIPLTKKVIIFKYLTDTFVFFKFQCATFIQKKLNLYSLQAIINIFDLPPPTNPTSKKIYNPKYAMDTSIFKKKKKIFFHFSFSMILFIILLFLSSFPFFRWFSSFLMISLLIGCIRRYEQIFYHIQGENIIVT